MTYEAERESIESRMAANWTTTDIKYENVDYTPTSGSYWVELIIQPGREQGISLPSPVLYRHPGVISINIYGPLNVGTKTIKGYADTIANIFRGQSFDGVNCFEAWLTRVGEVDGWFVYNVTVEFYWDSDFS